MKYLKSYQVFENNKIDFEYDVNFLSQDVLDKLTDILTPITDHYLVHVGYEDDEIRAYYFFNIISKNYGRKDQEYIDFNKLVDDFNFIIKYLPTLGFTYVKPYGVIVDIDGESSHTQVVKLPLDGTKVNNFVEVGVEFGPDESRPK